MTAGAYLGLGRLVFALILPGHVLNLVFPVVSLLVHSWLATLTYHIYLLGNNRLLIDIWVKKETPILGCFHFAGCNLISEFSLFVRVSTRVDCTPFPLRCREGILETTWLMPLLFCYRSRGIRLIDSLGVINHFIYHSPCPHTGLMLPHVESLTPITSFSSLALDDQSQSSSVTHTPSVSY